MEQLTKEIARLKQEAEHLRLIGDESGYIAKLREAEVKTSIANMTEQELLAKLSTVTGEERRPYEDQYQALLAAKAKEVVDDATKSISSTDTISIGGEEYTIDDLVSGADEGIILRQYLRQIKMQVTETASRWANEMGAKDDAIAQLKSELGAVKLERDDLASKRDAAVREAEEARAEVERLNNHVDDLRKQIAVGATAAATVIDIESDVDLEAVAKRLKEKKEAADKAAREAAEAAKVRIYDVQPGDLRQSFYVAKRADTDEAIEIRPHYAINNYVVLSNEEAARFREEYNAAQKALVESVPESTEETGEDVSEGVKVPPTFQDSETSEMGGDSTVQEVHGESATGGMESLEARVKLLEQKVAKLEAQSESVVAA